MKSPLFTGFICSFSTPLLLNFDSFLCLLTLTQTARLLPSILSDPSLALTCPRTRWRRAPTAPALLTTRSSQTLALMCNFPKQQHLLPARRRPRRRWFSRLHSFRSRLPTLVPLQTVLLDSSGKTTLAAATLPRLWRHSLTLARRLDEVEVCCRVSWAVGWFRSVDTVVSPFGTMPKLSNIILHWRHLSSFTSQWPVHYGSKQNLVPQSLCVCQHSLQAFTRRKWLCRGAGSSVLRVVLRNALCSSLCQVQPANQRGKLIG